MLFLFAQTHNLPLLSTTLTMKVFFIPGLGADKSVFQFLDLDFCEPVHIEWLKPAPGETLADYAIRLQQKFIPEDAVIVGLSFGGMLATEIAKRNPGMKVILISSAKTYLEIPAYLRAFKKMPLYKWLPHKYLKSFVWRLHNLFGIKSEKPAVVFKKIFETLDIDFTVWAMQAIVCWRNTDIPSNIIHIHGTLDKVLPYKFVHCHHTIERGGHLMVMEQHDEISILLKKIINASIYVVKA